MYMCGVFIIGRLHAAYHVFLCKHKASGASRMKKAKVFTYDRDIICLPKWYQKKQG